MRGRGQLAEPSGMGRRLKPIAVSVLSGAMFCVVLLLIMSVIITARSIPQSAIEPMAVFALTAGAFAAGFLCARALRSNGLINGALCGVALCLAVYFGGLFFSATGFGIPILFRTAFIMLPSMLGGVVGVNSKRRTG